MKKEWVRDYFTFTKNERIGILVLVSVILLLLFLPYFFPQFVKHPKTNQAELAREMGKLKQLTIDSSAEKISSKRVYHDEENADYYRPLKREEPANKAGELFSFNPNTTTASEWKRMGLNDKTIQTIQNYLSKGGHFKKPEDLYRIYGLEEALAARMIPYVTLPEETRTTYVKDEINAGKTENYKPKTFSGQIEINTADTTALMALPGIGTKLSQRIINFRDKLGGFYTVAQVSETFGLPDSTFQKIKPHLTCSTGAIKKININTADINSLKTHPYIRYTLGNVIVQYRSAHGNYSSLEDLKKIAIINEEIFQKIAHYLTVE